MTIICHDWLEFDKGLSFDYVITCGTIVILVLNQWNANAIGD
jgi:hypothetical protein